MRTTFDRAANAAYIYLASEDSEESNEKGGGQTYLVSPPHIKGEITLEFNKSGRLVGIEVLNATRILPLEVLRKAQRI